jgi:hypothetical protein
LLVARLAHVRCRQHDLSQAAQPLLLLLDQQLGITDNVEEEDVPNLEPKIAFGFSGHQEIILATSESSRTKNLQREILNRDAPDSRDPSRLLPTRRKGGLSPKTAASNRGKTGTPGASTISQRSDRGPRPFDRCAVPNVPGARRNRNGPRNSQSPEYSMADLQSRP